MIVLKNQSFLEREQALTDIEDRGYTFGDGVYEVIRIYNGAYFMLEEHLNRLQFSLDETLITYSVEKHNLKQLLLALLEKNQLEDGAIYLQITRGIAPRKHPFPENADPQLYAYPIPITRPTQEQEHGVSLMLLEDLRWHRCDIKSLNLLYNIMAKQKAHENGCYETLLYRDQNHVTEGSSSNFFGVKNGKIISHPANQYILNGITRIAIMRLCAGLNIPFEEKVLSIEDVTNLDEAFVASTTAEIVPVVNIDHRQVASGSVGNMTKKLQRAFQSKIRG